MQTKAPIHSELVVYALWPKFTSETLILKTVHTASNPFSVNNMAKDNFHGDLKKGTTALATLWQSWHRA